MPTGTAWSTSANARQPQRSGQPAPVRRTASVRSLPNFSPAAAVTAAGAGVAAAAAAVASSLLRSPNPRVRLAGYGVAGYGALMGASTVGLRRHRRRPTTSPTSGAWRRSARGTASPRQTRGERFGRRGQAGPPEAARRAGQLRPAARRQAGRGSGPAGLQGGERFAKATRRRSRKARSSRQRSGGCSYPESGSAGR